jgi:hypothetical protein
LRVNLLDPSTSTTLHDPNPAPWSSGHHAKLWQMVPLTAQDLWPLVTKLSHDEQVRLAKLALAAAGRAPSADMLQYTASPPGAEEFSITEDALAWDSDGWDGCDAPR